MSCNTIKKQYLGTEGNIMDKIIVNIHSKVKYDGKQVLQSNVPRRYANRDIVSNMLPESSLNKLIKKGVIR